ncbi:MAG: alpha/beta hydrolase [Methylococcus sp.]
MAYDIHATGSLTREPGKLLAGALLASTLCVAGPATAGRSEPPSLDGVATPRLDWQPCPDPHQAGFDCAYVLAPLDYRQPQGQMITLSVIRLPAADPSQRIGTLFFNPGGPGGSGTESLPGQKPLFPVGLRQRFDLVSWDPRGIGDSTAVQCFDSESARAKFFGDLPIKAFPIGRDETTLWLERFMALAEPCRQYNGDLLDHVSTADTARDLELLRRATGDERLNYLGVSYGTFLGATYANLFPDRVRAMALDGNVNPKAWFDKPGLSQSLRLKSDLAAHKVFNRFLKLCGQTDTAHCAFSAGTPAATKGRWKALMRRLGQGPIHIPTGALYPDSGATNLTKAGVLSGAANLLFFTLPGERQGWEYLAKVLQAAWQYRDAPVVALEAAKEPGDDAPPPPEKYASDEQGWAVSCGDSPNPRRPAFYRREAVIAQGRGGDLGPFWSWGDSPCVNWPGRAADSYTGPWNRETDAPILVIGNRFDPSTNYANSVTMSRILANARLLTVEGYGHTALLNPSQCANDFETRYFLSGELPPKWTVCPQDRLPFSGN